MHICLILMKINLNYFLASFFNTKEAKECMIISLKTKYISFIQENNNYLLFFDDIKKYQTLI